MITHFHFQSLTIERVNYHYRPFSIDRSITACRTCETPTQNRSQEYRTGESSHSVAIGGEVRQTLRDSLVQVNTLIREVKAQRRQDRLLQSTMDSLRKLSLA
jgi:hypothetical protein